MNNIKPLSPQNIENAVCLAFHVQSDDLTRQDRSKHLIPPRYVLWRALYEYSGMSYVWISRKYSRDHTTVMYGVKMAKQGYISKKYDIFIGMVNDGTLVDKVVDNLLIIGDKKAKTENNPHIVPSESTEIPQVVPSGRVGHGDKMTSPVAVVGV